MYGLISSGVPQRAEPYSIPFLNFFAFLLRNISRTQKPLIVMLSRFDKIGTFIERHLVIFFIKMEGMEKFPQCFGLGILEKNRSVRFDNPNRVGEEFDNLFNRTLEMVVRLTECNILFFDFVGLIDEGF